MLAAGVGTRSIRLLQAPRDGLHFQIPGLADHRGVQNKINLARPALHTLQFIFGNEIQSLRYNEIFL